MNTKWTLVLVGLMGVSFLNACAGIDDQQGTTSAALVDAALAPERTQEPVPTHALRSTDAPTPTLTPTPLATATPVPTSTPQVGDTRTNPDTEREETFTASGEWVEVEKWDASEQGPLPYGITSETARFEEHEDGSATLIFNDPGNLDSGRVFELHIPPIGKESLNNFDGEEISVIFEGQLFEEKHQSPVMVMRAEDEEGQILAFFDPEFGWRETFVEVLTDLGEQPLEPWMPQELGLLDGYYLDSGHEEPDRVLSIMLRPVRVVSEDLYWQGKVSIKVDWLVAEYNDQGDMLIIPLYRSEHDFTSGIIKVDESDGVDLVANPFSLDGNLAPDLSRNAMLDLMSRSALVNIQIILASQAQIDMYNKSLENPSKPTGYIASPGENLHYYMTHVLERDEDNHARQVEFAEDMLQHQQSDVDGVKFGYWALLGLASSG